ncbi:MAG: O-antigen ligase C-terminal domain-containing protein [Ramlibacter sp.]|nr:O-antigen ligase C-terminal domain-containing protein [Ramlibacter sp.]
MALIALAVVWIQWVAGVIYFAGDAWMASLYLLAFCACVAMGYNSRFQYSGQLRIVESFYSVLWVAALVTAVIGILQWLCLSEVLGIYAVHNEIGAPASGNMAQRNHYATLLLVGSVALFSASRRRNLGGFTILLALGFISWAMLLSQSRGAMLSASLVAIFLGAKSYSPGRPAKALAYGGALALLWLGYSLLNQVNDLLLIGGDRGIKLIDGNGRWTMWSQVLIATSQKPWTGYGWNQTAAAHAAGALVKPGELSFSNAHNLFVELLAWFGMPIGGAMVVAIVYWIVTRAIDVKNEQGIFAFGCLIPLIVHSMLEYPYAYAYFLLPIGVLVGVVDAHISPRPKGIQIKWKSQNWIFVLWLGLGGAIATNYLKVEEDFRIVRFENMRIGHTPSDYAPPSIDVLTHLAAMLQAGRLTARTQMPHRELELLREVSKRFPYGALNFRYAVSLALNGSIAEAERQLQTIHGMYGEKYYASVKRELTEIWVPKYPQLAALKMQ